MSLAWLVVGKLRKAESGHSLFTFMFHISPSCFTIHFHFHSGTHTGAKTE